MNRDRRAPVARYIEFRDKEQRQPRLIALADEAHAALSRSDTWTAETTIEVPSADATVVERRGVFRRPRVTAPATVTRVVAPGLAEAHRLTVAGPARMGVLEGCDAGRRLAALVAEVLGELVGDLSPLPVADQKEHAAYRQTLRLAAELTALTQVTEELGCGDPLGCVALRPPEAWGRREEDVEVAEVRAVLLQLAQAAARERTD